LKPKWFLETFFNFGLLIKVPSWKYFPIDIYTARHIIFLRMRSTEDVGVSHMVMFNNREVGMQV